jgi:hypothetical protein
MEGDNKMDLAKEYIKKIIISSQRALADLDKGNEQGIRLALGDLDYVESRVEAAKIIIREELKELKKNSR